MNILFLTIGSFESIEAHSIYSDLLRCFCEHNHIVYVIAPSRDGKTSLDENEFSHVLHVKTGDVTGTNNLIKKGISQIQIGSTYIKVIKAYFYDVTFDLVLYSTPPITLTTTVKFVKKRDGAKTYLLLKDIFPQNAVDLGMMSKSGIKGLLYRYFRKREKKIYAISDRIGCMSQANVDYILRHNKELKIRNERAENNTGKGIVEICPNSIELVDMSLTEDEKKNVRKKYGIPQDRTVFVYGGNLGKPQGIDHMLKCLHSLRDNKDAFFLIIGNGTEYPKLERYVEKYNPDNIALHQWLPKEDYDRVVAACDVGMIFLDHRFTIPNFPSRLLSYMQAKIPVLAVTDLNTDIGNVITGIDKGGNRIHEPFGWWCESKEPEAFQRIIHTIMGIDKKTIVSMYSAGWKYLCSNYSVSKAYNIIVRD